MAILILKRNLLPKMLSIREAGNLIDANTGRLSPMTVPLATACDRVLVEPVVSDTDSPPFDKSMMDGIAIRFSDTERGLVSFRLVARLLAGYSDLVNIAEGECAAIMTGSPIPAGADTVIMLEETEGSLEEIGGTVRVTGLPRRRGQNVLLRASTLRTGQQVLPAGHRIRAHDIGPMAEAGAAAVSVIPAPTLSVLATGDELCPVNQVPAGSQIRNSNGPLLTAMATPFCSSVRDLGIARDQRDMLLECARRGLESDVLVLSGGVSAGVADLVPGVLKELGVRQIFHKVAIKPGKPLWFGIRERHSGPPILVFGLPGNPVSSMCCFHVFVRPALLKLAGRDKGKQEELATLEIPHRQTTGRTVFWPSLATATDAGASLKPLDWKGSADLLTLARANAFGIFPGDRSDFSAGESVEFVWLERNGF
jgi:molybdopterin molybdotransferase